MLLGNRSSIFEDVDVDLPKRSGWYAVRASNWPKGCFVEASYLADKFMWMPVDGIKEVAQWRYLSVMEKAVVGVNQLTVKDLGSRQSDMSLYEMLMFAAELTANPRTRQQLVNAGFTDSFMRNTLGRMKVYGIITDTRRAKPFTVTDWGMFNKEWVYRNYEVLKRKVEGE